MVLKKGRLTAFDRFSDEQKAQFRKKIGKTLKILNIREEKVLRMRFGISVVGCKRVGTVVLSRDLLDNLRKIELEVFLRLKDSNNSHA